MFETVVGQVFKKLVLETLLAVFLAGIHLHAFLLQAPPVSAMGPQSGLLVDARIVKLVKLDVHQTLPFPAFFVIVTRPIWVQRVEVDARHKDARLIVEQAQRIGTKRHGRQAMCVAT